MPSAFGLSVALLASVPAALTATDIFDGMQAKETLSSNLSVAEAERCIVASGVSAYPVRLEGVSPETVYFLTLQTLSGRNPPAWRLVKTEGGSMLTIYDGRRYFRKARHCFQPSASD